MRQSHQGIASSALFVFVAGLVLWPPGAVYWTTLAAVVGDGATLVLVVLLASGLGAGFVWLTRVRVRRFATGGVLAYALWIVVIEAISNPDSPAHIVWYGVLLGSFTVGAVAAAALGGGIDRSGEDGGG